MPAHEKVTAWGRADIIRGNYEDALWSVLNDEDRHTLAVLREHWVMTVLWSSLSGCLKRNSTHLGLGGLPQKLFLPCLLPTHLI